MKTLYPFFLLGILVSLSSCVSVGSISFVRSPEYSPDKTIKVVNINTHDLILGRVEHHLFENGLNVVSDNYLRGAFPTGLSTTVQSMDTTFSIPQFQPVTLKLFEEQPADYILRYEYNPGASFNKRSFSYFNARLVNTQTGAYDASFTFSQGNLGWGKRSIDRVLAMFARALAGE